MKVNNRKEPSYDKIKTVPLHTAVETSAATSLSVTVVAAVVAAIKSQTKNNKTFYTTIKKNKILQIIFKL